LNTVEQHKRYFSSGIGGDLVSEQMEQLHKLSNERHNLIHDYISMYGLTDELKLYLKSSMLWEELILNKFSLNLSLIRK